MLMISSDVIEQINCDGLPRLLAHIISHLIPKIFGGYWIRISERPRFAHRLEHRRLGNQGGARMLMPAFGGVSLECSNASRASGQGVDVLSCGNALRCIYG